MPAPAVSSAAAPVTGTVDVVVTYTQRLADGSVEVAAYADGVIEQDGRCRVATVDGTAVGEWSPAEPDAADTSCGALDLSGVAADADLVVEYRSSESSGTSAPAHVG